MVDAEFSPDALARMARCLAYWQSLGYRFVSLPWLALEPFCEHTRPLGGASQPGLPETFAPDVDVWSRRWVASGEQSFLELSEGKRLPGEHRGIGFVGWTPCVRAEVYDATHHLYFTKVELFQRPLGGPSSNLTRLEQAAAETVELMVVQALNWVRGELQLAGLPPGWAKLEKSGPAQIDIMVAGLEVGSYGSRQCMVNETYVYGTGCAEPRFSQALELARLKTLQQGEGKG